MHINELYFSRRTLPVCIQKRHLPLSLPVVSVQVHGIFPFFTTFYGNDLFKFYCIHSNNKKNYLHEYETL